MAQRVQGVGQDNDDAVNKALKAGYEPGKFGSKGPSAAPTTTQTRVSSETNTSNNSTFSNSNDSLNANNVMTNKEAGSGGATASIKQAGQTDTGGQGGNQQGFTGGQGNRGGGAAYQETMNFSPIAQSKNMTEVLLRGHVLFPNSSAEEKRLRTLKEAVKKQYKQRFGIDLHDDVLASLENMSDPADLENALKVMATQKRSSENKRELQEFETAIQTAYPDFFAVISSEDIEKQRQLNT